MKILNEEMLDFVSGGTGSSSQYTVQPGDSLSSIANRFGVSVDALASANGLGSDPMLWVDQKLTIPA